MGSYSVYMGFYEQQNRERIPVANDLNEPIANAIIPLGKLIVE